MWVAFFFSVTSEIEVMWFQVFRPNLFKKSMRRFNVAWWAYSFPLTVLALASTEYAQEVKGSIAHILMLLLLAISVLVLLGLMVFTLFNTKMILSDNDPIVTLFNHLPRAAWPKDVDYKSHSSSILTQSLHSLHSQKKKSLHSLTLVSCKLHYF